MVILSQALNSDCSGKVQEGLELRLDTLRVNLGGEAPDTLSPSDLDG